MKLRGGIWWLKLTIPRSLRSHYRTKTGKPRTHIEETLGTGDRTAAMSERDMRVAYWQVEFRRLTRAAGGAIQAPSLADRAGHWRDALRMAANSDDFDALSGLLTDEAEEIEHRQGAEAAQRFAKLAQATEVPTMREAWKAWIDASEHNESTKGKYKLAFEEFMGRLKVPDLLLREVTRKVTQDYADWLNTEAQSAHGGPLAHRTKKDRITALASFWSDYVERRELVKDGRNPWHELKITGKRKPSDGPEGRKRPYRDEELLKLINGPEVRQNGQTRYPKRTLMELLALGLYTGARLDELCSRKVGEVVPFSGTQDAPEGGFMLHITGAKTEAGIRTLPIIHPIPVAILKARLADRKDHGAQLFAEFIPGGRDKKLSWYPQRALGRYRDQVGLGVETDFHSTRRSFITRLEDAGASPLARDRYVGHTPKDLASRVYSGGSEAQLLRIAETISYPKEIEEALQRVLAS
ncbi:MAG: hypothetical protein LT106_11335 [Burkholderiaceae bacterium]|nr:hypothetical protein [Burkholderiaceae bacterium]